MEPKHVAAGTMVFPLRCTEYERGWGSRPDGYILFLTESDRAAYQEQDLKEKRATKCTPDWYLAFDAVPATALKSEVSFFFVEKHAMYMAWIK